MLNSWIELGLAGASVNASTGRGDDRAFAFGDVFRLGVIAYLRRAGIPTSLLLRASGLVAEMKVTDESPLHESCLVVGLGGAARVVAIAALAGLQRATEEPLVVIVFLGALHDELRGAAMEWAFKERPRRGRKPRDVSRHEGEKVGSVQERAKPMKVRATRDRGKGTK